MKISTIGLQFAAAAYALTRPVTAFSNLLGTGLVVAGGVLAVHGSRILHSDTTFVMGVSSAFISFGALFGYVGFDLARYDYRRKRGSQRFTSSGLKRGFTLALIAAFGSAHAILTT